MAHDGAGTFRVSPGAYDGHVGRYGTELACGLVAQAGIKGADRVLDVGCRTGMLTAQLAACRRRVPDVGIGLARAEAMPFGDGIFSHTFAQLVVNFMSDPDAGVREMCRVTRNSGTVAAAVWDYAGEMTLLRCFWDAAIAVNPEAITLDEAVRMRYTQPDTLGALWEAAELTDVVISELRPTVRYASFDELWTPFTRGVAPSGAYTVALADLDRLELRDEFFRSLGSPAGSFSLEARAWAVVGHRS